ncbi:MAG: hypothetical protein K6G74_02300 [Bacilli bacterium]|nr:hypothetical protein [Bacilli bacterium]
MLVYSLIIVLGGISIALLNIFFNPQFADKPWVYALLTLGLIIMVILIDGLVAFLVRRLPEKWFKEEKGILKTTKFELKLYNFLRVSKWKEHVPELGSFTGFHKNKVTNPFDSEYLARFILEARYGAVIHFASVPTSFLVLLLDVWMYTGPSSIWLTIALPVAVVNAILILLPAFVLKYNLPKLQRLYQVSLAKKKKD